MESDESQHINWSFVKRRSLPGFRAGEQNMPNFKPVIASALLLLRLFSALHAVREGKEQLLVPDDALSTSNLLIQRLVEVDVQCYSASFRLKWFRIVTEYDRHTSQEELCRTQCSLDAHEYQAWLSEVVFDFSYKRHKCFAVKSSCLNLQTSLVSSLPESATSDRPSPPFQCDCIANLFINEIIDTKDLQAKWKWPNSESYASNPPADCSLSNIQTFLHQEIGAYVQVSSGEQQGKNSCPEFKQLHPPLPGFEVAFKNISPEQIEAAARRLGREASARRRRKRKLRSPAEIHGTSAPKSQDGTSSKRKNKKVKVIGTGEGSSSQPSMSCSVKGTNIRDVLGLPPVNQLPGQMDRCEATDLLLSDSDLSSILADESWNNLFG
jgi:hypothetical protein